jgi:hypothetical protein
MSNQPAVKSFFSPIKPRFVLAAKADPSTDPSIVINVSFWLEIINWPQKQNAAWAYCGDPRNIEQFGRKIVAVLNVAHWPVTGVVGRKDWRALRWLVCVAILERLTVQRHPILQAVSERLAQSALQRAQVHGWERCLWAAYRLKDHPFAARLENVPLTVGTLEQFSELSVRVNAQRLADWNARFSPEMTPASSR